MKDFPTPTSTERLILDLLVGKGETFGLDLVRASSGKLKRGTIYVTLSRMEDKGYVESSVEELAPGTPRPPRRLYRITGFGAKVMDQWTRLRELVLEGVTA